MRFAKIKRMTPDGVLEEIEVPLPEKKDIKITSLNIPENNVTEIVDDEIQTDKVKKPKQTKRATRSTISITK